MRTLIGLTGFAGSGKSTVAAVLSEHGFVEISLAGPLKEAVAAWFGWSHERMNGPSELRNAPDPEWGGLSARRALQLVGTEGARTAHPDVWIRLALRRASLYAKACISDVRFPNEAAAIRTAGGIIVRVARAGLSPLAHASEVEQAKIVPDVTLNNEGSLADLRAAAEALVK